ncbi:MAG: Rieske 2Fe-2S domain-containing protein [Actinomycetota bacterium]
MRIGSEEALREAGRLTGKVGSLPVLVVQDGEERFAIEDRCPHLGFPLARGTVADGLITCHWHHARFDLSSGCTLDPWADDARAFDVEVTDGEVFVCSRAAASSAERWEARLAEGLEGGLELVLAKAVVGLLDADDGERLVVEAAARFGLEHRGPGWGSGLTILVAMANVVPHLRPGDRAVALTHAVAHVSRDTLGHAPAFTEPPLRGAAVDDARLVAWYRGFVETRSSDAAERVVATALDAASPAAVVPMLVDAATDHVWLDGGHTLDFTNKAVELGVHADGVAGRALVSLVDQTCQARRAEESSAWRHPVDLVALVATTVERLGAALDQRSGDRAAEDGALTTLAWALLDEDAARVADALVDAATAGADVEQLARAVAYAAALRIVRFHTRNDHGDWDTVHHAFTTANACHQLVGSAGAPALLRAIVQGAMRVHLDRFLNIPAARVPRARSGSLADLADCWNEQGRINEAGELAFGFLAGGGRRDELVAALGAGLVHEDAGFHWFQLYEAAVRQSAAWPEGSDESALILVAFARFLAAQTPTRRELPRVVEIARRLSRGEALFEDDAPAEAIENGRSARVEQTL